MEDLATLQLIFKLHQDDLEEILSQQKGKGRAGSLSDQQLALQSYQKELEIFGWINSDRHMARSMADAVRADGRLILETLAIETQAASDRDLAVKLSGKKIQGEYNRAPESLCSDLTENLVAKLDEIYISGYMEDMEHDSVQPKGGESSTTGARGKQSGGSVNRKCVVCQELRRFGDTATAPCGHEYCRGCLIELFEASLCDESLFPPRCCSKPFILDHVRIFLNYELVRNFQEKSVEFSTPNRLYCAQPICSAFIPPQDIQQDQGSCAKCGASTCRWCRQYTHSGDCPEDQALQDLLNTAAAQGWQKCYSCKRFVELEIGCNHMRCLCKAEFCYVCGAKWKTCKCPQWHLNRLFARANQIVDRDRPQIRPGQAAAPGARQARVEEAMRDLEANHECQHRRWTYRHGPSQCEECHHNLPEYIFECQQCHMLACNRCKRNRL